MKRSHFMLAAERKKLLRLLAAYFERAPDDFLDITDRVAVPTKAGLLDIFYDREYGCILCCFQDEKLAAQVLHPGEKLRPGGYQRLNPCSGKWNFHFGNTTAEVAFAEFWREFGKVKLP